MHDRFRQWELGHEWIAVATGAIYVFIRFGVGELFKRFTVHRGMWHSVPACLIAGLLTFLTHPRDPLMLRMFLSVAVMLGFTIHLVLDEIWSVNLSTTKFGLKSSWGTAMKFYDDKIVPNLITYGMLLGLGAAVCRRSHAHELLRLRRRLQHPRSSPRRPAVRARGDRIGAALVRGRTTQSPASVAVTQDFRFRISDFRIGDLLTAYILKSEILNLKSSPLPFPAVQYQCHRAIVH